VEAPADEAAVFAACAKLHASYGIPTIVVTGVAFVGAPETVAIFVSEAGGERYAFEAARLDSRFTGSGDLTAALILAWRELLPCQPREVYRRVMASVTAVLARTLEVERTAEGRNRDGEQCALPELALVQSAKDIADPPSGPVRVRELPRREAP
jgi:pyridoxal/pyridoxine/pyridoxamine kinase